MSAAAYETVRALRDAIAAEFPGMKVCVAENAMQVADLLNVASGVSAVIFYLSDAPSDAGIAATIRIGIAKDTRPMPRGKHVPSLLKTIDAFRAWMAASHSGLSYGGMPPVQNFFLNAESKGNLLVQTDERKVLNGYALTYTAVFAPP